MSRKTTAYSRKRRAACEPPRTYTALDELSADPEHPMPLSFRLHQLTRMHQGLHAMERAPSPSAQDWRVCSDAVNLLETLVDMGEVEDKSGLLMDGITALAMAGKRHLQGQSLRLDGMGRQAVRAVLEDYEAALNTLSQRTMVRAHRRTEQRIHEINTNRRRPHDVEVVDL